MISGDKSRISRENEVFEDSGKTAEPADRSYLDKAVEYPDVDAAAREKRAGNDDVDETSAGGLKYPGTDARDPVYEDGNETDLPDDGVVARQDRVL